MHCTEVVLIVR